MTRRASLSIAATWACFAGIYLLFAGQVSTEEIVAACLCAVLATSWWILIAHRTSHRFEGAEGLWRAMLRGIIQVPTGTLRFLAAALGLGSGFVPGRLVRRFYFRGEAGNPQDRARRGFGTWARSLAPDSFVVRIDPRADEILIHVLGSEDQPENPRWPI